MLLKPPKIACRESLGKIPENQLRFYSTEIQNCCKVPYLAKVLFTRLWKEDSCILLDTNPPALKNKSETWKTANLQPKLFTTFHYLDGFSKKKTTWSFLGLPVSLSIRISFSLQKMAGKQYY